MTGFGFPKAMHLVKTDEISSVFTFNRRINSEHFQILVKPGLYVHGRLAVIVSKRIAKLANRRNYIKRLSREVFRLHQDKLSGMDIVVRVKKQFDQKNREGIVRELLGQLDQASARLKLDGICEKK